MKIVPCSGVIFFQRNWGRCVLTPVSIASRIVDVSFAEVAATSPGQLPCLIISPQNRLGIWAMS